MSIIGQNVRPPHATAESRQAQPVAGIDRLAAPSAVRLRAIALWQPWASLMLGPSKRIETRSWFTGQTGPLLIHAAKIIDRDGWEQLRDLIVGMGLGAAPLPTGAILGVVNLVRCVSTMELHPGRDERRCGDFSAGRWGWVTEDPRPLKTPIPWKGAQGFFGVELPWAACCELGIDHSGNLIPRPSPTTAKAP